MPIESVIMRKWEFKLHMKLRFVCFCLVIVVSCTSYSQNADTPVVKPAATSADSPEKQQFQKIEDSWATAVNDRDQYGLELVLSPLFVDVSASGDITTRNQQVASIITGEDKTIHLEQRVITVRSLGDIVIANGTYSLHRKVPAGPVDEKGVFTHVFERTRGGWLCINSQRTLLREDSPGKQKKKSEAEMPFHIPFISK
jgi:ketosteroid isomerase-like protein